MLLAGRRWRAVRSILALNLNQLTSHPYVVSAHMAAAKSPPLHWTPLGVGAPGRVLDLSRVRTGIGSVHKIGLPIHVYPLYENAFRARKGQPIDENNRESARLYAEFAKVAEKNLFAWSFGERAKTEEEIGTASKRNRMICAPCKFSDVGGVNVLLLIGSLM